MKILIYLNKHLTEPKLLNNSVYLHIHIMFIFTKIFESMENARRDKLNFELIHLHGPFELIQRN